MKTISTKAGIDIPIFDEPIGVSVSGGADSAILLYILMKHTNSPIHIVNMCCKSMNRLYSDTALAVATFCVNKTDRKDVTFSVEFVDSHNPVIAAKILYKYIKKGYVGHVYTGMTSTPSTEILTSEFNISLDSSIAATRNPDNSSREPTFPGYIAPFIAVNKKKIAELYTEYNVLDDLFPITRSCYNRDISIGHCKMCWWCDERRWAFGRYE